VAEKVVDFNFMISDPKSSLSKKYSTLPFTTRNQQAISWEHHDETLFCFIYQASGTLPMN
jgi:hypothetical protein